MTMKILVLNSGSSSQKACLYEIGEMPPETPSTPLWEGKIEWRTDSAWIAAIGGMAAVLAGVDAVVFTAGVGENSPEVRAAACRGLEFAGWRLNCNANAKPMLDQDISTPDSSVRVLVIRAEEDWAIAKECWKLTHAARPAELPVQ